jgi:hypothetical protein
MHRFPVLLVSVLTLTATAAFAAEGTFEKTLSVSGVPNVSISTGSGYVHVFPGSDTQVHIVGHVHSHAGWFGGDADSRVKEIVANPPITQSGTSVTVGGNHGDASLFQNISIDYDVTTPRMTTLTAHSGSGELRIGGIEGAVVAGSGSGDVEVENVGGNSRFQSGSGSIRAKNVHGAATLEAVSGTLDLDLSGAGDVKARTGSGSIRIHGLNGSLHTSAGSGSIDVEGNPAGEWRIESGSGSIEMRLQSGAKFNLYADTSSGTVHVDQPILMQGSLNQHHVSGTVHGGGATVRASTGSGDITVR